MSSAKQLRYYVMLALYFPLLLYSVSTFDLSEETYAVKSYKAVSVGEPTVVLGQPFQARAFLAAEELASAKQQKDSTIRPQLIAGGDLAALGDSALTMATDDLLAPGEDERRVLEGQPRPWSGWTYRGYVDMHSMITRPIRARI